MTYLRTTMPRLGVQSVLRWSLTERRRVNDVVLVQ